MELALARFRLLFKHPFGTAHGLRDGTDCVLVRLGDDGHEGYGEATLPPYLKEDQDSVIAEIMAFARSGLPFDRVPSEFELRLPSSLSSPARAAISTAYYDLIFKKLNKSISSYFGSRGRPSVAPRTLVTLGHSELDEISLKLKELPASSVLKVKLGSGNDLNTLDRLMDLDHRDLVLDVNQAWSTISEALNVIDRIGPRRIAGVEQPFAKHRWDLHAELTSMGEVCVIGDESIQDPEDLRRAPGTFGGINLKLMKCGGVDVAADMLDEARRLGLMVMLGSMSESSLGCGAMASLAAQADLLDLDGPWLIKNDPYQGLGIEQGDLIIPEGPGFGIELRSEADLDWATIGA
ncbi:MAG: hypothetical protein KDC00_14605 [Flavobacteriales bacterium]|nr:hypothetical protein [Flavobacteriales bacterium]